jgi:tRNA (cytidine/uridine-2'-O-)-methyltransferase
MRLALFEPDIPQNTGTILRLAACLGVEVDIIEPCGFLLDDRRLRRAGMDYLDRVAMRRHASWTAFENARREVRPSVEPGRAEPGVEPGAGIGGRLVLLTTRGDTAYADFRFEPADVLLVGRESAGVPEAVHAAAEARLRIPMAPGVRSLNVAVTAAMVLGEALRQTNGFPKEST